MSRPVTNRETYYKRALQRIRGATALGADGLRRIAAETLNKTDQRRKYLVHSR